MIKQKFLYVKNKDFPLFKEQMKWSGEGTQNDPIVIDFINETYTHIYFTNIEQYVRLMNLKNKSFRFKNCQNFQIEGCKIKILGLIDCLNINVKNNVITKIVSLHSGECTFTGNTIVQESYERIQKGYHNRKYFSNFLYHNLLFLGALFTFLNAMLRTPIAAFDYFVPYLIGFLMMIPFVLKFFPKPLVRIICSRKYPPHKFENNNIISQEQFNLIYTVQQN